MDNKIDYKAVMKAEFSNCAMDPIYFLKRYVYIQAKGGRQLFTLYLFQEKLLRLIQKNDRTIILKSRQLGITTLCAGYCLWLMIFQSDQSILALAPDRDKAQAIISKLRFAYDNLPSWIKQNAKNKLNNTSTLELSNGSRAQAVSGASKSARSKTANFVILDEGAFIDNAEELWGSAQQTLATIENGKAIILSTPNGFGNWFNEFWEDAEENLNGFVPVKLPWTVHPERDQKWRDQQEAELGKKLAAQECDAEFLTSGNTYFETEDLDYYKSQIEEPIEMRGATLDYWIWKYPNEVGICAVIIDTAKGDGGDNSSIQVIEIESGDQVAEYKGQMEPKDLAKFAVIIALEYKNALVIAENTGLGETTVSYLKDTGYENIFYSVKGNNTDVDIYLDKFNSTDQSKLSAGFPTTVSTRPLILHNFRQYVIERRVKLRSRRLNNEMFKFIWKNGKPQAASGYHDDLILPYSIGLYLRDSAIAFQNQGLEMQKAVLGGLRKNAPLASYTSNSNQIPNDPFKMRIGNDIEDISWVLGR